MYPAVGVAGGAVGLCVPDGGCGSGGRECRERCSDEGGWKAVGVTRFPYIKARAPT